MGANIAEKTAAVAAAAPTLWRGDWNHALCTGMAKGAFTQEECLHDCRGTTNSPCSTSSRLPRNWSRNVLVMQIEMRAIERQGGASRLGFDAAPRHSVKGARVVVGGRPGASPGASAELRDAVEFGGADVTDACTHKGSKRSHTHGEVQISAHQRALIELFGHGHRGQPRTGAAFLPDVLGGRFPRRRRPLRAARQFRSDGERRVDRLRLSVFDRGTIELCRR